MRKIIIVLLLSFVCISCEKFLDVTPTDVAYDDKLLTDRSGFEAALAGAYITLNGEKAYGKALKYGFMETLVGSYASLNSSHLYYRSYEHSYNYEQPKKDIEGIWQSLYSTINQMNIILANVEKINKDPNYLLIKGEALGIRALCHFELLKIFGPVILQEGASAAAIPYRDAVDLKAAKFLSATEVRERLNKDLEAAKVAFEKDPIRTNARTANLNALAYEPYNSLIDRRGTRMNYYAVVALQALLSQWFGDMPNAGLIGESLISELQQSKSISLVSPVELSYSENMRFPIENIFGLMTRKLYDLASSVLPPLADTQGSSASPLLFPNYNWLKNNLYNASEHGTTNDYRLNSWFKTSVTSSSLYKLNKFLFDSQKVITDDNYTGLYETKIISLHTIYLLVAEAHADGQPEKAIAYLNLLRNARNIAASANIVYDASMSPQVIRGYIFDELRKDNIGDGYLFSAYKRLFKDIDRPTNVKATVGIFKIPVPDDELLFNPQN